MANFALNAVKHIPVNPELSSGLPIPALNRYPQPASRPERYATPATKASDPAFNPYFKRDTRRAWPQTSVISQEYLADLLIASPEGQKALPGPSTSSTSIATSSGKPSLTEVLSAIPATFKAGGIAAGKATASSSGLPPSPPGYKWKPKVGDDIPHAPDAYWPMVAYK